MTLDRRRGPRGRYIPPPAVPLAPIDRVVDEGVLIGTTAVRMAVKNRLIVAALREGSSYDADALAETARAEFDALARENEQTAARLDGLRDTRGGPASGAGVYRKLIDDREEHRRRPEVHRALAEAFRAEAADAARLGEIVGRARDDAWHEISREIVARLISRSVAARADAVSERERQYRLRQFIELDLAALRPADG